MERHCTAIRYVVAHDADVGCGISPDALQHLRPVPQEIDARPVLAVVMEDRVEANGPNVRRGGAPDAREARCRSTLNARPNQGRWRGGRISARRWNQQRA